MTEPNISIHIRVHKLVQPNGKSVANPTIVSHKQQLCSTVNQPQDKALSHRTVHRSIFIFFHWMLYIVRCKLRFAQWHLSVRCLLLMSHSFLLCTFENVQLCSLIVLTMSVCLELMTIFNATSNRNRSIFSSLHFIILL